MQTTSVIPIPELLEELKLKGYAPTTLISYQDSLLRFAEYLEQCNITDLRQVSLHILNDYKVYLINLNKHTLNTIHLRLRALRRMFEYLERTNQLLINPCSKLVLPSLGKRLPKNILTRDEIKKLLFMPNTSTTVGIRDRAILEMLYSTGIRLAECINVNVYDVDYTTGHVRITKGKGSKDRIVPLGKLACRWLEEYLVNVRPYMMREEKVRKIVKVTIKDERALWVGQKGKRIHYVWLNRVINQYAHEAGIQKQVTVHTLRRTFATHMLQEGANPYYIQRLLGHKHASTMNRYIQLIPKEVKESHKKYHPREKDRKPCRKNII